MGNAGEPSETLILGNSQLQRIILSPGLAQDAGTTTEWHFARWTWKAWLCVQEHMVSKLLQKWPCSEIDLSATPMTRGFEAAPRPAQTFSSSSVLRKTEHEGPKSQGQCIPVRMSQLSIAAHTSASSRSAERTPLQQTAPSLFLILQTFAETATLRNHIPILRFSDGLPTCTHRAQNN